MALSDPAQILYDLNQNRKYNYLYIPEVENLDHVHVDIVSSHSERALSHPHHQITGSLDELHTLYLAIENYLRIETILPSTLNIYRVSEKNDRKLYQVLSMTKSQTSLFLHIDHGLDLRGRDSRGLKSSEITEILKDKSERIQKIVSKQENGLYTYQNTLKSNLNMRVTIGQIDKDDISAKICVKTEYFDFLGRRISQRCTVVEYTRGELTSLRFALLDFLRYQLDFNYKFEIKRSTSRANSIIESIIRPHRTISKMLAGMP